jgi:hypothetical protein
MKEVLGKAWDYAKELVATYPGAAIILGVAAVLAVWIF